MEDENISGTSLLELIKENRKQLHKKAHFSAGSFMPNAILIHPNYYTVLKDVMNTENSSKEKRVIFDLEIFETEDIASFKLIKAFVHDNCSI